MAMALRASARTAPVPSAAGLSAARGGILTLSVTEVDDPSVAYLAIGVAAGVPATYSDLSNDQGGVPPITDATSTVTFNSNTDKYSIAVALTVTSMIFSADDNVYVAVFLANGASPPDGATAPDAVAGPISVGP